MTGTPDRRDDEMFSVTTKTIPAGIRCRPCGRLHLPARLWPLAIDTRPGGGASVELRCVRCSSVGSLFLDADDPEHRALLTMWRDLAADGDGDDTKASA